MAANPVGDGRSSSDKAGSFIRPSRPFDTPISTSAAVRNKYASESSDEDDAAIRISGKQIEEVGFDKIRTQLANLEALRVVVLDGMCISTSDEMGQTCPNIEELDLSRNLFESFNTVLEVISQLPALKILRLDGNRFSSTSDTVGIDRLPAFLNLESVNLDNTLLTWKEIMTMASLFPRLTFLSASSNELEQLSDSSLLSNVEEVRLEMNNFQSMNDLLPVLSLPNLRVLSLKGNKISIITRTTAVHELLATLDLSYNQIATWQSVDELAVNLPGMTSLRMSYNPLYRGPTTDEDFLETVARVANLTLLNHSQITDKERQTAETFYLSKIGRELSAVPEEDEPKALIGHPRYSHLCLKYGKPVYKRQAATLLRPDSLAAGLLQCTLELDKAVPLGPNATSRTIVREIPGSFTIYNLLGLIGRLYGIPQPSLLDVIAMGKTLEQRTRPLATLVEGSSVSFEIQWSRKRVQQAIQSHAAFTNA